MISFQEVVLILIGVIVFIIGLGMLNDFVGGVPFFTYVGTPVALGLFVLIGGFFVAQFHAGQVGA